MTDFTVKVRRDENDTGSNRIEVLLDTDPRQEIMILSDRGDDIDEDEYGDEPDSTALYYAVERIAQLEAERDTYRAAEEAQIALREKVQARADFLKGHSEILKEQNDELAAQVELLKNALRYASDYLSESRLNSIGHGSKAHREMDQALSQTGSKTQ